MKPCGTNPCEVPHTSTQDSSRHNTTSKETEHMREWTSPNSKSRYPREGPTHRCRCDYTFQVLEVCSVNLPSHHYFWAAKVVVEAALGDIWHRLLGVVELYLLQEWGGDLVVESLGWQRIEKWVCCTQSNLLHGPPWLRGEQVTKQGASVGKKDFPWSSKCRLYS